MKRAYVTFCVGRQYAVGTLALAASLARVTDIPLVVMCLPETDRAALASQNIILRDIDAIESPPAHGASAARYQHTYSKLAAFGLTEYDRLVYLDSDAIVLQNIDELFMIDEFAAAPNLGMELDYDSFNSGVFCCQPSHETFHAMLAQTPTLSSYDGGDQGFLNAFFPNARRLDRRYNVLKRLFVHHPDLFSLKETKVLHFVGRKPWEKSAGIDHGYEELERLWCSFVPRETLISLARMRIESPALDARHAASFVRALPAPSSEPLEAKPATSFQVAARSVALGSEVVERGAELLKERGVLDEGRAAAVVRKLRKLQRDPSRFYADLVANKLSPKSAKTTALGARTLRSPPGSPVVARLFVDAARPELQVSFESLRAAKGQLSLLLEEKGFRPSEGMSSERRLKELVFADGVRPRVLEVKYGPEAPSWSMTRLLSSLERARMLPHAWPMAIMQGEFITLNPQSAVPFVLARAWPGIHLITILDYVPGYHAPIWQKLQHSRVVLMPRNDHPALRQHSFAMQFEDVQNVAQQLRVVRKLLVRTERDVFLPILLRTKERVPESVIREHQHHDGILLLPPSTMKEVPRGPTFSAVLAYLADRATGFLLKESWANRYSSLLEARRGTEIFRRVTRDGARIAFVELPHGFREGAS